MPLFALKKLFNQKNRIKGFFGENMNRKYSDSLKLSFGIVTGLATIFTILGFSMKDVLPLTCIKPTFLAVVIRALIIFVFYIIMTSAIYLIKYLKYKNQITLRVGKNKVKIKPGNIFNEGAWRVIAVDTHFDTTVDDVVISKSSLHGQLVLEHGEKDKIEAVVKKEAEKRKLTVDLNGKYTFPLGTAIPYEGKDGHYIMVALTDLDSDYEAHTMLPEYESTMMKIWRELSRVYAKNDLAIPILGSGITRFDDDQDDPANLLRCMLCTLNTSKVHFKSYVSIIIYDGTPTICSQIHRQEDGHQNTGSEIDKTEKMAKKTSTPDIKLPLYEYKDLFRIIK